MKQYKRLTDQKWSKDIDLTQELGYSYIRQEKQERILSQTLDT